MLYKHFLLLSILICLFSCSQAQDKKSTNNSESKLSVYVQGRKLFKTNLTKREKSPQTSEKLKDVNGTIKLVFYESAGRKLKGLLDTTNIEKGKPKPAIVYLHGGFSLGYADVTDCKPFTDAGYVVFAPSYRGENGNSGYFELMLGEVDDANEAIKWLAKQDFINKDSIFVFGHSIGGGIALSLSLHPDAPINKSGSSAGVYDVGTLKSWEGDGYVPFDYNKEEEAAYRLPIYSLQYMVRPHQMYIGKDDDFEPTKSFVKELYPNKSIKMNLIEVEGNHFSSLQYAMEKFLAHIKNK